MNYYALSFGAIAICAVAAIDYVNQARVAGAAPGEFSASAYASSVSARLGGGCVAGGSKISGAANAPSFLPGAPEGWTRSAWQRAGGAGNGTEADNRGWIYQRGDAHVAIQAELIPADGDCGPSGWTIAKLAKAAQNHGKGWAVIGGAAYERSAEPLEAPEGIEELAGTRHASFRSVFGLGDAIRISVVSTASEGDTRSLLSAIDYDGLNGLLSEPLPSFGSAAPAIPIAIQAKAADILLTLQAGSDISGDAADRDARMAARLGVLMAGAAAKPDNAIKARATGESVPGAPTKFGTAPDTDSDTPSKPKRLMLSGGKACLDGSASRFCRD